MIAYILLSHHADYLPFIFKAMHKFAPNVQEYVFVQVEGSPMPAYGGEYGARDMLVPSTKPLRMRQVMTIMDYILTEGVAKQEERYAWIAHCDLIPLVPIDPEHILGEATVAGPGSNGQHLKFPYTWTLIDKERWEGPIESIKQPQKYNLWDAVVLSGDNVPDFLKNADYDLSLEMEFCAPGFLHARHVSWDGQEKLIPRKVALVNSVLKQEITPSHMPSLFQKLVNFEKERRYWFASGRPVRPVERIQQIFEICQDCEHSVNVKRNKLQCRLCGCNITANQRKLSKNTWATTECPDDPPKWLKEPNLPALAKQGCGGCGGQRMVNGESANGSKSTTG